jgi:hypothetical protein
MVPFRTALTGNIEAPKNAYPFLSVLAKWAQKAAKDYKPAENTKPAATPKPAEPAKPADTPNSTTPQN